MSGASIAAADNSANRVNVGHGCDDGAASEAAEKSCPNLDFDRHNDMVTMFGQCPSCFEPGETRMLMTAIPLFREIIVASFSCDHCGHANTSVDFAGAYQDQGCTTTLNVTSVEDLQRQVVKSDSCHIKIPEIEFEICPNPEHKQGVFTTLQGVLNQAISGVEWMLWNWKEQIPLNPDNQEKILGLLNDLTPKKEQLETLMKGETPFTVIMDDAAGNSFISCLNAVDIEHDVNLSVVKYTRTEQQNLGLGFSLTGDGVVSEENPDGLINSSVALNNATVPSGASAKPKIHYDDSAWLKFEPSQELDEAVMQFGSFCEACGKDVTCNMFQFMIPHFREVILMSASCEACGNRSREIKPGGAVPDNGRRCTLRFEKEIDLRRGVIKSDSACVTIPEIELEMQQGTLGGMFTTVEGLLVKIKEHLEESNPFGGAGDGRNTLAAGNSTSTIFAAFLDKVDNLSKGNTPFTLIVEDAMAGSFIENPLAPENDPQLTIEDYERTHEENEELGLNDIRTEGYQEDAEREELEAIAAKEAAAKAAEAEEEEDDKPSIDGL
eukprot:TRINITY_DN44622_c0_g1_i1.p1 TRINITY_DN44622_c0_g1~~TRINITY_DN44622_c0_g1_i1.p1  ORF type:complete len:552 (-),score=156.15 TRINITY_DN44622_c0_g1_i1:78-1733(-)